MKITLSRDEFKALRSIVLNTGSEEFSQVFNGIFESTTVTPDRKVVGTFEKVDVMSEELWEASKVNDSIIPCRTETIAKLDISERYMVDLFTKLSERGGEIGDYYAKYCASPVTKGSVSMVMNGLELLTGILNDIASID